MISSFKTSEVKEMETMFKNSVSKSTRDMSIIAAPASATTERCEQGAWSQKSRRTLVYADHQPLEERLVGERSSLKKSCRG